MWIPWQKDCLEEHVNGASRRSSPGRADSAPRSSPFGFDDSTDNSTDDVPEPVDMPAIRADDQLLDDISVGADFAEDQHIRTMLFDWRSEIDSDPFPELMTTDQAAVAIAAGQRSSPEGRRLRPIAAAVAIAALTVSGAAAAASGAHPGDALWGISTILNGQRAQSLEAEQRVTVALTSARAALAEGRIEDARAVLSEVAPDLAKIEDLERRDTLLERRGNLHGSAAESREGERVHTDEKGRRTHRDPGRSHRSSSESGAAGLNHSGDARSSSDTDAPPPTGRLEPSEHSSPATHPHLPATQPGREEPLTARTPAGQPSETPPSTSISTMPARTEPARTEPASSKHRQPRGQNQSPGHGIDQDVERGRGDSADVPSGRDEPNRESDGG